MTDYKKQSKTNSKLEVKCEYENSSFNECSENESCFLSHGLINDNDNNNKLINKMSDHNLPNGNDVLNRSHGKILLKIWSLNRSKKCFVCITGEGENLISETISKASKKLGLNGYELVLESDGTLVDDDDILPMVKDETLILLEGGQSWIDREHALLLSFKTVTKPIQQSIQQNANPISSTNEMVCKTEIIIPDIEDIKEMVEIPEESANELLNSINFLEESQLNSNSYVDDSINVLDIPSTSNEYAYASENILWTNFEIPWSQMSYSLIKDCENGNQLKRSFTTIIQIVVNSMRDVTKKIGTKPFRIVARKLMQKYPKMFRDKDDEGNIIGYGESSLHFKLVDRNNYLNRLHKRGSKCLDSILGSENKLDALPCSPKMCKQSSTSITKSERNAVDPTLKDPTMETMNSCDYYDPRFKDFEWEHFVVPWHAIPIFIIQECDSGTISKRSILAIVHIVVDALRELSNVVPSRALKIATRQIIDEYPILFQSTDEDGIVLDDGFTSLYMRMQDRNHYLNRTTSKKNHENSEYFNQISNIEIPSSDTIENNQSTLPDSVEKKNYIIEETPNNEQLFSFFESTYVEQRNYIEKKIGKSVAEIKRDWPILFDLNAIYWHFNKLTRSNIHCLESQIESKYDKIIKFAETNEKLHDLTVSIVERLDERFFKVIHIISLYFGEDLNNFYVEDISDESLQINFPYIVKVKEIKREICDNDNEIPNMPKYHVHFEDEIIKPGRGCTSFLEAFKVMFALFMIFNIKFPKQICLTLEMIQRYFFKIHPNSKRMSLSTRKTICLIHKLKKI